MHVDTRWKFQAMYDFGDYIMSKMIIVHVNLRASKRTSIHLIMVAHCILTSKTQVLSVGHA